MLFKGVDLLTITKVIEDSREKYEAATPGDEIPVASIELPEDGVFTTVFKDGMAINAYPIGTDQSIKIATSAISPDTLQAIINGGEGNAFIDTGLAVVSDYALGFRIKRIDGSFDYYSYPKGHITINAKTIETEQGTSATVESITFKPLTTRHAFAYNGKPCRKIIANDRKHGVIESGWRAIQWTPDNFLPVPAPVISVTLQTGRAVVALAAVKDIDTVHYTLDGTTPTADSETAETPLTVALGTVVKAVECTTCKQSSAVAVAVIDGKVFDPAPILAQTEYATDDCKVVISNINSLYGISGFRAFYTLDGSDPTEDSEPYTGAISLDKNVCVKMLVQGAGYYDTPARIKIDNLKAIKPSYYFIADGSNIKLYLSTDTEGAALRYTLDGTTPTETSALYTGAITVSESDVINVRAFKTGINASDLLTLSVSDKLVYIGYDDYMIGHDDTNPIVVTI